MAQAGESMPSKMLGSRVSRVIQRWEMLDSVTTETEKSFGGLE
jgi:hypothetical protein